MATAVLQPQDGEQSTLSPAFRVDWATAALCGVAIGLLVCLAAPVLRFWAYEYTKPESDYAHAPLIPFLVGLMLWHRRTALAAVVQPPALSALGLLVPALGLLVCALKIQAESLESAGLLLTLLGSVWLVFGICWVRAAAVPLGFVGLMAPLPGPLLNDLTLPVQGLSTTLANGLLHLLTFSTVRTGNVIEMAGYSLFVDVPCAGFKLLLALLTFSAAFAALVDGSRGRRAALLLISLPLSVLVNSVRIALIGMVGVCWGPAAAHLFHDWSGLLTLTLGFIVLFGLAKGFGCRTFAGWPLF